MSRFKDKKVAVLGFGIEGRDAVGFLLKKGANVDVFDRKEKVDTKAIDKKEVNFNLGSDYLKNGLKDYDLIIRSPGVYRYLPEIVEAEENGVKITSTLKIFFDLCPSKTIGVTGTKGKGTTSTLIYKILKKEGKDVHLVGNIGKPFLEILPELNEKSWVVVELSSFQLIDLRKSPHIAVVLNVTSDHLDWHKDRGEYVEAKKNIVRHQKDKDFSVINKDYRTSSRFAKETEAKIYYFSKEKKVKGVYIKEGKIYLNLGDRRKMVGETKDLLVLGEHNWENTAAAICASGIAGASLNSIKNTVFSYKGMEHRLELVDKVKGVTFYNDSASTNPQTTIAAIKSFDEPLTLILGGSDKGLDYKELFEEMAKSRNFKCTILIGEIAGKLEKGLKKANFRGEIVNLGTSSMSGIVTTSFNRTKKDGIVLLSPAAASFDMFSDYKQRGKEFKKYVKKIGKSQ